MGTVCKGAKKRFSIYVGEYVYTTFDTWFAHKVKIIYY